MNVLPWGNGEYHLTIQTVDSSALQQPPTVKEERVTLQADHAA